MTSAKKNDSAAMGHFEPELTHLFLPGCRNCGGSHPLARKPVMPEGVCPDCDAPQASPGQPIREKATLIGYRPSTLVARTAFAISKALITLSKRI